MRTLEEFKKFFNEELLPELRPLDRRRKGIIIKAWSVVFVFVVLWAISMYFIVTSEFTKDSPGWPILATLVFGVLAYAFYREVTSNRKFYLAFKAKVIDRIVKFINPNFIYISHKYVAPFHFVNSKLFPKVPKKYKGDDYVGGRLSDDIQLECSEIEVKYLEQSPDGKRKELRPLFHGLFFVAQVDLPFKYYLLVLPRGTAIEPYKEIGLKDLQECKVEDEKFSQYFTVFSNDCEGVAPILKGELPKLLVEFKEAGSKRQQRRRQIYLSVMKNRIYMALPAYQPLFEPYLYRTLINYKNLEEYFLDLNEAVGVTEAVYKALLKSAVEKSFG